MGLNIKNEQTVALVRELAHRTGLSQTSAVEKAVRAKLAEFDAGRSRDARRIQVSRLLSELDQSLTAQQKRRIRVEEKALYDDDGLPV
jgi:antitoxin VapB